MVHQDLAAALYAGPQARPVTGPDRQVKLGAVQDSFRFEHKIKVDALVPARQVNPTAGI